jgi:hypothetical protein
MDNAASSTRQKARKQRGDLSWEQMGPAAVAEIIKAENRFGWQSAQAMSTA